MKDMMLVVMWVVLKVDRSAVCLETKWVAHLVALSVEQKVDLMERKKVGPMVVKTDF